MGAASTMVVHVAPRGKDMAGLMRYLYGSGKGNEHTNQHTLAGSLGVEFGFAGGLSLAEASELGRALETSWHEQVAEANALVGAGQGGVSRASMKAGQGPVSDGEKEHVYHLIVSLPPAASWSDEQWATVAGDLVQGMGFTTDDDDEQGCRWAAIRHGLSGNGNDHLHVAVNLVRQDGRRVQLPPNDFRLAQEVRQRIEATRDFVLPLHDAGRAPVRSLPGYTMTEHALAKEWAQQSGLGVVPDRVFLQQVVRAASVAAATEAQWLDAVLDPPDVEVEAARWAPGGRDEVTGYKVRVGDGPWFSASQLASDLTLQKLRPRWAGNEDDISRRQALAIWREEVQLPAPVAPAVVSTNLDAAEDALARWAGQLRGTDPQDKTTWRHAAVQAAGVVSSLSRDPGADGEVLAGAGQTLSRQALAVVDPAVVDKQRADQQEPAALPRPSYCPSPAQLAARHVQLAMRAGGTSSHPGWIAVLQQLRQVLAAIEAAQRARRELAAAQQLAGAQRAVGRVEQAAHARYGRRDVDELREAWRARETSRVGTRGAHHPTADGTTPAAGQTRGRGLDGRQQTRSRGR